MEELIMKYLTGNLGESEKQRFVALLSSDETVRRELAHSLATLAITDYSLDNATENDVVEKLEELLRQ